MFATKDDPFSSFGSPCTPTCLLCENHKICLSAHESESADCPRFVGKAECTQLPVFGQWQRVVTDHVVSLQAV
jgi:hypothetical protein